MTPTKKILLNTQAILDILYEESREDRLKQFERAIGLLAGRLERLETKQIKNEKRSIKKTK